MLRKTKLELNHALSSRDTIASAAYLNTEITVDEKEELFKFLLNYFRNAPDLLTEFFQHSSHAYTLEASEMEKLEDDFKGYILEKQTK